jgi:cellulose synthase/poly-beta-1,6-N-acetylglucosamine synthase-like glycosyltransferase
MNNAYHDGVKIARPFEWAKNAYQNLWTKVSAAYYIRDSRIPSNFRERAGLSSMLTGAGMMVSMEVVKKYGWDAMGLSEDAEYTLNRVMDNERVHYVADAIVFEDQPSSLKDTFSRNKRMGNGLFHLFFKKGFKYLGHFFKTGNFSFIDLFMQLFFIPVGVLCIIWFPLYYIFIILSHTVNAFGPNWMTWMTPNESSLFLWNLGIMVGYILAGFVLVFAIQTWLALIQSKKHLGLKNLKGLWGGVWLGFVFMIIYDIAITAGVFSKPKWVQIKRNKEN